MRISLPEELHFEILRRLSPTPQVLARASAVCREWRHVVNDHEFLRELYRARCGAPVTVGFFHNAYQDEYPHRFVHMDADDRAGISVEYIDRTDDWQFVDCRHGRVLLKNRWNHRFLLWHPLTGIRHLVLETPAFGTPDKTSVTLICDCATTGVSDDNADKLDHPTSCHANNFGVAVVYNHTDSYIHADSGCLKATIYSSVTRLWSSPVVLPTPIHQIRPDPCAVVGKTLYQPLCDYLVLAYDIEQGSLTTFERPKCGNIRLFKADGGVLGLVGVLGFALRLWARYTDVWVMYRTIDLSKIHPDPRFSLLPPVNIIGVANQGDVLFMWTMIGIFMLCPESMEVKKVHGTTPYMNIVYPYGDFYLPPLPAPKSCDIGPRAPDNAHDH
ncbi:hypothetical protein VPH35_047667 [Triticum aestivum]